MPGPHFVQEEETSSPLAYGAAIVLGLIFGVIGGVMLVLYLGLVEITC